MDLPEAATKSRTKIIPVNSISHTKTQLKSEEQLTLIHHKSDQR